MPGALTGVRVLDFGQYVAGPVAAMLLADQGAEVVRVDPPSGPRMRTPANQVWNRGKQTIVLDLHIPHDQAVARTLVERADVLIENFRPGVMERLDLGPRELLSANPSLVYCSLPGFAPDDPRAQLPAWENVVQAAAAVPWRPQGPSVSAIPIASLYAAIFADLSIAMALRARERDGAGQHIEIPLFNAALGAHGFRIQRRHQPVPASDPDARIGGLHGWMGVHRCQDDRYVFFHPGNKRAAEFVQSVGGADWAERPDFEERVLALFRSRSAAEWEELGDQVGTEIVTYRTSAEWLREPHALRSGTVIEQRDPIHGRMRQPGVAVRLDRTPGSAGLPPAAPFADPSAVFADQRAALHRPIEASTAKDALACLEGIRVLELSLLLAGPTCGRALMEFGAEVIKIESPYAAEPPPAWTASYQAFHVDVNRGKRNIVLDLKADGGRELFLDLAADADVIVQNFRPGVTDALGIGYESVRAVNPRIVYASVNTYGVDGPWSGRPGHEHLGQAATGMAERFGGDNPPAFQVVRAPCDYATGLLAAYAVGLALLERDRSGEGQQVNASLTTTATTLQSPFMYDYDGHVWDEPRGQESLGASDLQCLYRCRDGWLAIGCLPEQRQLLTTVVGIDPDGPPGAFAGRLASRLLTDDAAAWAERISTAGLGAHPLRSIPELVTDDGLREQGLVVTREHDQLGLVDHLGSIPRLSRTPTRIGRPAARRGDAGRDILIQCGHEDDLDNLVSEAVVTLPSALGEPREAVDRHRPTAATRLQ